MLVRLGIFCLGLTSLSLAEEAVVLDHHGDKSSGNYPVNIVSTDYAEISVIEEVPNQGPNNDKSEPHKVKVHKSFHRKHKGLPQVAQPRDNQKIEELSDDKKGSARKTKRYQSKKLTDTEILAQMQETAVYQWWLEASARKE